MFRTYYDTAKLAHPLVSFPKSDGRLPPPHSLQALHFAFTCSVSITVLCNGALPWGLECNSSLTVSLLSYIYTSHLTYIHTYMHACIALPLFCAAIVGVWVKSWSVGCSQLAHRPTGSHGAVAVWFLQAFSTLPFCMMYFRIYIARNVCNFPQAMCR